MQCMMCATIWDRYAPQTHVAHAPSNSLQSGLHPESDWDAYATANGLTQPYPRYKTLDVDPQPPPANNPGGPIPATASKAAFERQVEYKKEE
jgi:hypothetical protein